MQSWWRNEPVPLTVFFIFLADRTADRALFLLALRNVAAAHGGLGRLSRKARLNRANLCKIFSKDGNPEIYTLIHILKLLGLRLAVAARSKKF